MTSDSGRPSEGAMRAANEIDDMHDLCATPLGLEHIGQAIDREAVQPAVKPLVEALGALEPHLDAIICYASTMSEHEPNRLAANARAALAPWRHLIDKED